MTARTSCWLSGGSRFHLVNWKAYPLTCIIECFVGSGRQIWPVMHGSLVSSPWVLGGCQTWSKGVVSAFLLSRRERECILALLGFASRWWEGQKLRLGWPVFVCLGWPGSPQPVVLPQLFSPKAILRLVQFPRQTALKKRTCPVVSQRPLLCQGPALCSSNQ